jgi:hypothetical protein
MLRFPLPRSKLNIKTIVNCDSTTAYVSGDTTATMLPVRKSQTHVHEHSQFDSETLGWAGVTP